jgi:hypothetical protein
MTVLLCLLSEQHVPNLLPVHHFEPDWLVLVETAGMKRRQAAANFLQALRLGGREYSERCRTSRSNTKTTWRPCVKPSTAPTRRFRRTTGSPT